jgi:phosphatidylinositol alpha-1,6-mannosyltransferase
MCALTNNIPSILLATESLAPGNGGICRVARLMARVLAKEHTQGLIRVEAVSLSDNRQSVGLWPFPVITCSKSRLHFVWTVQNARWRHSHVIYDFAGMARAHRVLGRNNQPYATWMHGIEVWEGARKEHLKSVHDANFLFSNSAFTRGRSDALHGGLSDAKLCWLATEEDVAGPQRERPHGHTVMILGRMDSSNAARYRRYKGHEQLIECWHEVVAAVPDARLLIIGGGPGKSEVMALAKASPAADSIEFRGFVPDSAMAEVFAESDVFAMPSRGEGFGLVYIEAMRNRLPVIASKHDAAPEVNIEGETGYNVDLDQPAQLPERIIHLLKNPDVARRMGEAGQARWNQHFRFGAFRDRFQPLLREWLGRSQA